MATQQTTILPLIDHAPDAGLKKGEILGGLLDNPKRLPCKLFYDAEGSRLFDQICDLPEYYPTRTETQILRDRVDEIGDEVGESALLIEYGSGSSTKTRVLLDHLGDLAGYVPIDISKEHLLESVGTLGFDYPDLSIQPICADYNEEIALPSLDLDQDRSVVFFPGSTIGNFHPSAAIEFLRRMTRLMGNSGGAIIGVDLKKDRDRLEAAYDDAQGVTAAFNKNALVHLEQLGVASFDPSRFEHLACYNESKGRVEMHLVSTCAQAVDVEGTSIRFDAGERIHTESSYKYTIDEFARLAGEAGLRSRRVWTDDDELFSVHYVEPRHAS